uniref:Uncharacterized protein n=1 Tax=Anguilla anguilla TaxID=7936 RepID=A0A0E9RYQ3_ANGAN
MSVIGIWTCRPLDCSMERGDRRLEQDNRQFSTVPRT